MTPEEQVGAKIIGAAIAVVILTVLLLVFGPRVIDAFKALDDGPAHPPAEWRK